MPITIWKADDKYQVAVSPPHGSTWRVTTPMSVDEIVNKLIDLGCHTTDIGDAFYAADPFWTEKEGKRGRPPPT
jgi:hypothetical protein